MAPSAAAAPASPPELTTVRVGMIPSLAGAPLLAGADLGIFERNGIELEITPFTDTAAAMTQVVTAWCRSRSRGPLPPLVGRAQAP